MSERIEITSMDQFHQLPMAVQQKWKNVVMSYVVVSGSSSIISDQHDTELNEMFDILNGELSMLSEDQELTTFFLSPLVEARIVIDGTRALLKSMGWGV